MAMQVDATEFLAAVLPALEAGDARRLAQAVRYRWKPRQICSLLRNADPDVRRVAAVALGFVGDRSSVEFLTRALHDEDKQVNQMAEHGLWSIWFRSGDANLDLSVDLADFNGDASIDLADFNIWLTTVPPDAPLLNAVPVPEPTTMALFGLVGLLAAGRRRRIARTTP